MKAQPAYRLGLALSAMLLASLACSFAENLVSGSPAPATEPASAPDQAAETGFPYIDVATDAPASPEAALETPAAPPEPQPLQVIYLKDGNIWRWVEGGATQQLTQAGSVNRAALSDDGALVAYERQTSDYLSELWVVGSDGSNDRRLVSVEQLAGLDSAAQEEFSLGLVPHRLDWAPGSHILAFNTRQVFEGPGMATLADLRLLNADSGELTTLLPAGQGGDFYFSPDGAQIALVTPEKIDLVNRDGSNRRAALEYEPVITYSEYQYHARPVWAQDSSALRVAIPPRDPLSDPIPPTAIWNFPVDGSPAAQLGSVPASQLFSFDVALAPNLTRVAYLKSVGVPEEGRHELHLANADGSQDATYSEAPHLIFLAWAPDSQHFLLVSGDPAQIYLGAEGQPPQPVGASQGVPALIWVDAQRFLYANPGAGIWELRLATTGGVSTLIDTSANMISGFDF